MPAALTIYINSSFIASFVGEKFIGLTYTLASLFSILALLLSPKIFRKIGVYKFLLLVTAADAASIYALSLSTDKWTAVTLFIFNFALNILITFSIDEIIKIYNGNNTIGSTRGLYLAVCHLAFIFSQIFSGTLLRNFSFRQVYLIAFWLFVVFFTVCLFKLKNISDPTYDKDKIWKYVGEFFQDKKLRNIYKINLLLQIFYCWMVIYTPLYLYRHMHFSWNQISLIFAIMLLPFSIIPIYAGKYADKIGERNTLMLGFLVVSLSSLFIFFIQESNLWIWAIILFITRVGAAIVEVDSDAYFFKHIKPENEEKLINKKVENQKQANQIHNMVGGKVRQTIKNIGGKMPEKMLPEKHIKELKKDVKKITGKIQKQVTK
jgi:MFS family permease